MQDNTATNANNQWCFSILYWILHHPTQKSLFITRTFYCLIVNSFREAVSLHHKLLCQTNLALELKIATKTKPKQKYWKQPKFPDSYDFRSLSDPFVQLYFKDIYWG